MCNPFGLLAPSGIQMGNSGIGGGHANKDAKYHSQ